MKLVKFLRKLIICNLLILLSFREGGDSFVSESTNEELRLNKIDVTPNSLILEILKDVRSDCANTDGGQLFTLRLNDYKSGEKAYILQELDHKINAFNDLLGYTIIDNDNVVIYGKQIPDFSFL